MISIKTIFQILEYFGFTSAAICFLYLLITGGLLAPGIKELEKAHIESSAAMDYVFMDTTAVQRTQTRNKLDSIFLDYCKKNKVEIVPGY